MANNNNFGKRLKSLREEKNIPQKELASLLGLQKSTISLYESGRVIPPSDKLSILADRLGISADYLLGRTEEKKTAHGEIIITPVSSSEDEVIYDVEIKGEPEISDYDKRIINILMKQLPSMSESEKKNMIPFIQSLITTIRNSDDV